MGLHRFRSKEREGHFPSDPRPASLLMGLNGSVHPIAAAAALPPIAVSSGSACTSATLEPSYVLKALGVGDDLAHTSIRFGLGRFTTEEEVDYVLERIVHEVTRLPSFPRSTTWRRKASI